MNTLSHIKIRLLAFGPPVVKSLFLIPPPCPQTPSAPQFVCG